MSLSDYGVLIFCGSGFILCSLLLYTKKMNLSTDENDIGKYQFLAFYFGCFAGIVAWVFKYLLWIYQIKTISRFEYKQTLSNWRGFVAFRL